MALTLIIYSSYLFTGLDCNASKLSNGSFVQYHKFNNNTNSNTCTTVLTLSV